MGGDSPPGSRANASRSRGMLRPATHGRPQIADERPSSKRVRGWHDACECAEGEGRVKATKRKRKPRGVQRRARHGVTRWLRSVKTVSTFPPPGTFSRDAADIARVMAMPRVSPKGIGSAIRMVQFFLNRGGKNLSAGRRRELEKAKRLLQARHAEHGGGRKR